MRCDVDPCDTSPSDIPVFAEFAGLKWYQCENWDFGPSHGGGPSAVAINGGKDSIFPRVTRAENTDGVKRYRKVFGKNVGVSDWNEFYVNVIQNANQSFSRDHTAIVKGTLTDDMFDKPNDAAFSSTQAGLFTCAVGDYFALWIRQELYAGGTNPQRGQDIVIQIELMED